MPNPEVIASIKAAQSRTDYLDHLYDKSGRSNPEHPDHDSYSGLYQERDAILKMQGSSAEEERRAMFLS